MEICESIDEKLLSFYSAKNNHDAIGILINNKTFKKLLKEAEKVINFKMPAVFKYRGLRVYTTKDVRENEIVIF